MANVVQNTTEQQVLGSMFFGTTIAFILHGVTCCQMIWFFRNQLGRSSKRMISFVIFVWLAEVLNCASVLFATLDMFIYAAKRTSPCADWIARAQAIPEVLCTMSVEGFFIVRVWRLSEHKKLTMMLLLIPFLASNAFAFAQIFRSLQLLCKPGPLPPLQTRMSGRAVVFSSPFSALLVYGTYISKFFLDGVVAAAMCYMLYTRSSGFTRRTNTIKIVRGLILWSISTGVLMWIINVLFLLSLSGFIPSGGFVVFFITGGIYVNAMFAQLNSRVRFRAMAEASMPLSSISLGGTSSSEPVDRELHPLDPT